MGSKTQPCLEISKKIKISSSNAAALYLFGTESNQNLNEILEWESTILTASLFNVFGGKPTSSDKEKLQECVKTISSRLGNQKYLLSVSI